MHPENAKYGFAVRVDKRTVTVNVAAAATKSIQARRSIQAGRRDTCVTSARDMFVRCS